MISAPGKPLVYLISDGSITPDNYKARSASFLKLVDAAVKYRIPYVQIREKHLSARLLFDLASDAVRACQDSTTRLLINDRLDVALSVGADGVHLTADSVTADVVRKYVPDGFVIAKSTHSIDEIHQAKSAGADFAVFGPIFETPGKRSAVGLEVLAEAANRTSPFPVLALGGVDETNYRGVLDVGSAGFAAIRFLNNTANLAKLSMELGL